jgi:hypothetical protein
VISSFSNYIAHFQQKSKLYRIQTAGFRAFLDYNLSRLVNAARRRTTCFQVEYQRAGKRDAQVPRMSVDTIQTW